MKRIIFILLGIVSFIILQSCNDRDEIRQDIDNLNDRVDKLQETIMQYNEQVAAYDALLTGTSWMVDFSEHDQGYTIKLNNGKKLEVYNGEADLDYSPFRIGLDEKSGKYVWYYNDEILKQNGETVPVVGENGVTPQVRVNENGRWEFSFDGEIWKEGDNALPRAGGTLFDDVKKTDENGNTWIEGTSKGIPCLTFSWTVGGIENVVTIPTLGGLKLTLEVGKQDGGKEYVEEIDFKIHKPFEVKVGESLTVNIKQKGVKTVVIETTDFAVQITDKKDVIPDPVSGEVDGVMTITPLSAISMENIYLKIFSAETFCKLVLVPVKVLS